jgi:hypothetical protein
MLLLMNLIELLEGRIAKVFFCVGCMPRAERPVHFAALLSA